jgi:hypothetical protein
MFKIFSTYIFWKQCIRSNIWRVAVRPSYKSDARFLKVKQNADYTRYLQSKKLSWRLRLSTFNIIDLLIFVGFSEALVYKLCTKSCRTNVSFVKIGSVTAMLYLRVKLKFYPYFFKFFFFADLENQYMR